MEHMPSHRIEELSGAESRHLLATHDFGRLAVIVGGYPELFPVNYAVVRDRVLVRTDPGTKLAHARFERVCFQIDHIEPARRLGWSVLLKGVMHEMDSTDDRMAEFAMAAKRIAPWAAGARDHVLVITPVSVTGRRLVPPALTPELTYQSR